MGGGGGEGQDRGGGGASGWGGQGGCERRSVAFVKIQKKNLWGGGGGGEGWGGVRSGVGVGEVARIGVGGDVGYGGCKPRIKGIDKCK